MATARQRVPEQIEQEDAFQDGTATFLVKWRGDEEVPSWEVAADLLDATRGGGARHTLCGVEAARVSTEIGFAIHESHRSGGGRVQLPVEGRAAGVVVDSRPWGN